MKQCQIEPLCNKAYWLLSIPENRIECSPYLLKLMNGHAVVSLDSLLEQINFNHRQEIVKSIREVIENKISSIKVTFQIKSGLDYLWVECLIKPYQYDANQNITGIAGICNDIDHWGRKEKNYSEILFRYRKLLNHITDGIILEDETGKVFFVNQKFCEFFDIQYSPYDIIGTDIKNILDEYSASMRDSKSMLENYKSVFEAHRETKNEQIYINENFVLEMDCIPIIDDEEMKGHLWIFKNITRYIKNEERFQKRLEFEELVISIATKFIDLEWTNIDKAINETISKVGKYIQADRSYVLLFENGTNIMNKTNEWVNTGIQKVENNVGIDIDTLPWLKNRIKKLETTYIPDINHLPEDANIEKAIFNSIQIKSLVIIPLVFLKSAIGYLGIESVSRFRLWDEESIKLLNIVSIVISNAIKRKINEEALYKGEERYKLITKLTSNYAYSFQSHDNYKSNLTWMTGSFKSLTGYMLEDFESIENLDEIIIDEDKKYYKKQREELDIKKSIISEFRIKTKDGQIKWIEEYAIAEKEEDHTKIYIAGKDITLRKENEEKIYHDRNLLRTIIDNIPDPIYVKDTSGRKVLVNEAEAMILGAEEIDEVLYKTDEEFYPPDVVAKTQVEDNYVLSTGTPLISKEGFVITRSGETKWFIGNKIPQRDVSGKVIGLVGISYNITQRKKAEEEIRKALQKEKELSELKTELVVKVSHEFRTPLAALLSSSELLELYWEKLSVAQRTGHLSKIKKSIKNLIDILGEITEINKLESGRILVNESNFNSREEIEEIIEELKTGDSNHPEIITIFEGNLNIISDKKIFKQIAMNLISNAFKYTNQNKKIWIKLERNHGNFVFSVKDEGIGIPENELKMIFEPFIRCSNVMDIKGTGLGLSILKSSVETLNGKIEVNSTLNEGSEFIVSLPLNN